MTEVATACQLDLGCRVVRLLDGCAIATDLLFASSSVAMRSVLSRMFPVELASSRSSMSSRPFSTDFFTHVAHKLYALFLKFRSLEANDHVKS